MDKLGITRSVTGEPVPHMIAIIKASIEGHLSYQKMQLSLCRMMRKSCIEDRLWKIEMSRNSETFERIMSILIAITICFWLLQRHWQQS
jgi:hypothetical protein